MRCPVCNMEMRLSDRQGIEIDYCPQCRGIWLDRGELDKIIDRTAGMVVEAPDTDNHRHMHVGKKKRGYSEPAHDRDHRHTYVGKKKYHKHYRDDDDYYDDDRRYDTRRKKKKNRVTDMLEEIFDIF